MRTVTLVWAVLLSTPAVWAGVRVGVFAQQVRTDYGAAQGLPSEDVQAVAVTAGGEVYAGTRQGLARFAGGRWKGIEGFSGAPVAALAARGEELLVAFRGALWRWRQNQAARLAALPPEAVVSGLAAGDVIYAATDRGLLELKGDKLVPANSLHRVIGGAPNVRQVAAAPDGRVAVAAESGLYLRSGPGEWRPLNPRQGRRSWAPFDVRGVAFDAQGRLWFASPQGAGCLDKDWTLYSGYDGLPYDDFTTVAAGEDGAIWFGTRRGAIRYDGRNWEYRQGRRWLPDDEVRAIAVSHEGHAWFATAKGVALIEQRPMTLSQKARFFEDEIDRRHRRTPFGYVNSVRLKRPGDLNEWIQRDSDNDGLWTGMYGAGECFAYAATRDPAARRRARAAFEALRFLSLVTQGGRPPARPGFVARTILPADGPDPNLVYTRERDETMRATRDRLWKILHPRWPVSADGKWYWKADTSSDELDGHYFFYALYYDLVAETPEEKDEVRRVVTSITDHLLAHDFMLIDWDGLPTRWAVFSPAKLNQDPDWWVERGLNSLSILSYLSVAEHMTGAGKYRRAAERLIREHHYAQNLLVPKIQAGPGTGNQSDDEMALMSFYNLIRYEQDEALRAVYALALHTYCRLELPELNPLFNFICAACLSGQSYQTAFARLDLMPRGPWLEESVDTLKRYPLDRVDWRLTNSHRKDIVPLAAALEEGETRGRGCRRNGRVLPVDERFVEHWNHDPWRLDQGGEGLVLADGASFLLPYYMGLYHAFIVE